jgi:predicted dehydrogenase
MAKKHRIAVIGHTGRGNYGHGIDTVWRHLPDCEIVAVADADASGRAKAAKRLAITKSYADYKKMLDEVKPAIVSICPRWLEQHHDMVLAAARRGIHVYMEKPFCRDLTEADVLVAACEKKDVKLAIAFQTRYSPILPVVRSLIEEGRLGTLLELRGRGKEDRRGGGEDLWVLGTHIMNLIQFFGGEPNWCFASVLADKQPVTKKQIRPGPEGIGPLAGDRVNAMYGHDDGVTSYFGSHRNAGERASRFGLTILGSKGAIELTTGYIPRAHFLADPHWSSSRSGKQWLPITSAGVGKKEPLARKTNHDGNIAACRDLLAAIEEDRQPEASIYEARATVEMIAAVFESHRVGGPVTMPLKTRKNPLTLYKP